MKQDSSYYLRAQANTPLWLSFPAAQDEPHKTHSNQYSYSIHPQRDTQESDGVSEAIPSFDLARPVMAENGRIDKIELANNLGTAGITDDDDCAEFRKNLRYGSNKLFNTAPDKGTGYKKIKIRKSTYKHDGAVYPKPLFSGHLKTYRNGKGLDLNSSIFANPTRALRFFPEITNDSEGVFETSPVPAEPRALDRKTNCLPSWVTQEQYLRGEKQYFKNVFVELENSCSESSKKTGLFPVEIHASKFCLKTCEVYFEFHQPDARKTLRSLQEHLLAYVEDVSVREHAPRTEANDKAINGNEESVKARLSKTEHLIVYAKTANRLRFEARYFYPSTNIVVRRSSKTLERFFRILDVLRQRAAERINSLLGYLRECFELPPKTIASNWRYKEAWFNGLGWSELSDEFLETLRLLGRLCTRQQTEEEQRIIRKAKRAGLIRYVKERGVYVAEAGYANGN